MKSNAKNLVFVVENDHFNEKMIKENFHQDHTHEFVYFKSSAACLHQLSLHPMAVLIDHELKTLNKRERDALKILEKIKELDHHTEVVFYSSMENKELAQDMIQHGAYDYVTVSEYSFLKLQKTLSNIEKFIFHKKSTLQYRLWTWISLGFLLTTLLTLLFLYVTGHIQDGKGELLEP
jgi:DNA-binding NtrC family response regulator